MFTVPSESIRHGLRTSLGSELELYEVIREVSIWQEISIISWLRPGFIKSIPSAIHRNRLGLLNG